MRYNIRVRLAQLDKSQRELKDELASRGYSVTPQRLSAYIKGHEANSYSDIVLEVANVIIKEWENDQRKNH